VINRIVQWGSLVFIGSTLAFLLLNRAEAISDNSAIERSEMLLVGVSVLTLPLALTKVVREGDPKSRRSWALLFGLCIVLVSLVFLFTK
jgi:hypothetical protein